MAGIRCCVAVLLLAALPSALPAQVIVAPPPVIGVPVLVPGLGFSYQGRHVAFSGYYGPGTLYPLFPYGVVQNRVSVQFIAPTVVVAPRRVGALDDYDLSGVDLDVVPASVLHGEPPARREPPPREAMRPRAPDRLDLPARPQPPPKKAELPAPRKEEPAKKPEAPPKHPADDLWVPRAEPAAEARRLIELGIRAFRAEEYGVAGFRFRQATEAAPTASRAFFLLGQAEIALGNFREAVRALGEGLRLQPDWPAADFRPKAELYDGREDDWAAHRERVLTTHRRRPRDFDCLFLLGYLDWFGDRRREALDWFRAARPLLPDPTWVDLFLKSPAAPVPPA